jgi:uncharacterized protein YgiM (DUF1202 family)
MAEMCSTVGRNAVKKLLAILGLLLLLSLGWSSVTLADDTAAYIDLAGQNLQATVIVPQANLRSGPGENYAVLGAVTTGTRMSVLGMSGDVNGWYLIQQPTSETAWVASWIVNVSQAQVSATLAPAASTLYISLDTSPGFYERLGDVLNVYGGSGLGVGFQGDIDQMLSLLFSGNPFATADEVRPWLGNEVAIVNLQCLSTTMSDFLMTDSLQETPRPSVVIMAQVISRGAAQGFIDRMVSQGPLADAPQRQMNYGGYNYILLNDPTQPNYDPEFPPIAMGLVGDYAVFTQGEGSYQAVVDTANGAPSLNALEGFQNVYGGLVPGSFLKVFVSPGLFCPVHEPTLYPALLNDAFANGEINIPGVDPNDTAGLQERLIEILDNTFYGYGVGFRNVNSGLTVDLVSGIDEELFSELTGLPPEQVQQIADNSGLEVFGFLSPSVFQGLAFGSLIGNMDTVRDVSALTPGAAFSQETGMTSDVLEWLDGSITMGFIDYPVFIDTASAPSYFLMVVESSDETKSRAAYDRLVETALTQPGAKLLTENILGVEVKTVEVPRATAAANQGLMKPAAQASTVKLVQFAVIGNYVILTTGGNIETVIQRGTSATTDGSFFPDWRALAGLPERVDQANTSDDAPFLAYMDLARTLLGTNETRVYAAAIITPADLVDGTASRITIICSICRDGATCND